jgi:hypothetical protein
VGERRGNNGTWRRDDNMHIDDMHIDDMSTKLFTLNNSAWDSCSVVKRMIYLPKC